MKRNEIIITIIEYFLDNSIIISQEELEIIPTEILNKLMLFCAKSKLFKPLFRIYYKNRLIWNMHKQISDRKAKILQQTALKNYLENKCTNSFSDLESEIDLVKKPPSLPPKTLKNKPVPE